MGAPDEHLLLLDRRVAALRKTRPDLAAALGLQETLIRTVLTSARPPETQPFPLPREQVATRVRNGIPLLHEQPVWLDIHYAADLFSRLINAFLQRDEPELSAHLRALAEAATSGRLDPQQLFSEAFVQHLDHLAELADAARVDPEVLSGIASQSVAPLLRAYAARLQPLVAHAAWEYGYCPICGGWPLIGEVRGDEMTQWLRCAACASSWRARPGTCPFCGNDDARLLRTLTLQGESRFSVAACERCKGFFKIATAFDAAPAELLALDDVASLQLEIAAVERGFRRPPGSGYRIELAEPEVEWVEEM